MFGEGRINNWHPDYAYPVADIAAPGESAAPTDIVGADDRKWFDPTYGWQMLRLRRNSSGGYIDNSLVTEKSVSSSVDVTVASGNDIPMNKIGGVTRPLTMVANAPDTSGVPTLYYFWAVVRGRTTIVSGAAITQGAEIATLSNAGKVDDRPFSGGNLFGRWLAADPGGADTAGICEVNMGHIT